MTSLMDLIERDLGGAQPSGLPPQTPGVSAFDTSSMPTGDAAGLFAPAPVIEQPVVKEPPVVAKDPFMEAYKPYVEPILDGQPDKDGWVTSYIPATSESDIIKELDTAAFEAGQPGVESETRDVPDYPGWKAVRVRVKKKEAKVKSPGMASGLIDFSEYKEINKDLNPEPRGDLKAIRDRLQKRSDQRAYDANMQINRPKTVEERDAIVGRGNNLFDRVLNTSTGQALVARGGGQLADMGRGIKAFGLNLVGEREAAVSELDKVNQSQTLQELGKDPTEITSITEAIDKYGPFSTKTAKTAFNSMLSTAPVMGAMAAATMLAGPAGTAVTSLGVGLGSQTLDVADKDVRGLDQPMKIAAGSVGQAALDVIGFGKIAKNFRLKETVGKAVLQKINTNPIWRRIVGNAVKSGSWEGVTEAGQAFIENAVSSWTQDPGIAPNLQRLADGTLSPEAFAQYLDEGLAGAMAGGAAGGAGGGLSGLSDSRFRKNFAGTQFTEPIATDQKGREIFGFDVAGKPQTDMGTITDDQLVDSLGRANPDVSPEKVAEFVDSLSAEDRAMYKIRMGKLEKLMNGPADQTGYRGTAVANADEAKFYSQVLQNAADKEGVDAKIETGPLGEGLNDSGEHYVRWKVSAKKKTAVKARAIQSQTPIVEEQPPQPDKRMDRVIRDTVGEATIVDERGQWRTLADNIADESMPQITSENYRSFLEDNSLPPDTDPADVLVLGNNTVELATDFGDDTVRLARGSDATTVVREAAQRRFKRMDPQAQEELTNQLGIYESVNGRLTEGNVTERLSDLAAALYLGDADYKNSGFTRLRDIQREKISPESIAKVGGRLQRFLTQLRDYFRRVVGSARKLRDQAKAGKVDQAFLDRIKKLTYGEKYVKGVGRIKGIDVMGEISRAKNLLPAGRSSIITPVSDAEQLRLYPEMSPRERGSAVRPETASPAVAQATNAVPVDTNVVETKKSTVSDSGASEAKPAEKPKKAMRGIKKAAEKPTVKESLPVAQETAVEKPVADMTLDELKNEIAQLENKGMNAMSKMSQRLRTNNPEDGLKSNELVRYRTIKKELTKKQSELDRKLSRKEAENGPKKLEVNKSKDTKRVSNDDLTKDYIPDGPIEMDGYHGSKAEFEEFDANKVGTTDAGFMGNGFYFYGNKQPALAHGKNIIKRILRLNRPLNIAAMESNNPKLSAEYDEYSKLFNVKMEELLRLERDGYDVGTQPLYWTARSFAINRVMDKFGYDSAFMSGGVNADFPNTEIMVKDINSAQSAPSAPVENQTKAKPEGGGESNAKLLSTKQMLEDAIDNAKMQGKKPSQAHLDKLADINAQLNNQPIEEGLASNAVFGHPMATNIPGYENLIPIKVRDDSNIQGRIDTAQKKFDDVAVKVNTQRAIAQGRVKSTPAQKKKAKEYLNSKNRVEDETVMDLLKSETLPELYRLQKAIEAKQAKPEGGGEAKPLWKMTRSEYLNSIKDNPEPTVQVRVPSHSLAKKFNLTEYGTGLADVKASEVQNLIDKTDEKIRPTALGGQVFDKWKTQQSGRKHYQSVLDAAVGDDFDWNSDLGRQHEKDYPELAKNYKPTSKNQGGGEAKQPWEMSKAEWDMSGAIPDDNTITEIESRVPKKPRNKGDLAAISAYMEKRRAWNKELKTALQGQHKRFVQRAISEGKIASHPDYPELTNAKSAMKGIAKTQGGEALSVGDIVKITDTPSTGHLETAKGKSGKITDIQMLRGKQNTWAVDINGEEYFIDSLKDIVSVKKPSDLSYTLVAPTKAEVNKAMLEGNTLFAKAFSDAGAMSNRARVLGRDGFRFLQDIATPVSKRLGNIHPTLERALRRFDLNYNAASTADQQATKPLLQKIDKLYKTDRAKFDQFDLALKNGTRPVIEKFLKENGMETEYKQYRSMMDRLYARAAEVGLDIGYQTDYWPRMVEDLTGLRNHIKGGKYWSNIQIAVEKERIRRDGKMTHAEEVEYINTLLRGYGKDRITLSAYDAAKQRVIPEVTPEMNKFYASVQNSLFSYIMHMNEVIEARKFFGQDLAKMTGMSEAEIFAMDDSMGAWVKAIIDKQILKPDDELVLVDVLRARFHSQTPDGWMRTIRNLTYLTTMNAFTSSIRQLDDMGLAWYRSGSPFGIFNVVINAAKAVVGQSQIDLAHLGLEPIMAEFVQEGYSGRFLQKIFKLNLLPLMDKVGKETLLNTVYSRYQKEANSGKLSLDLTRRLKKWFGDNYQHVIDDLKAGRFSEDVRFLMFNDIADIHPISLSEFPLKYLEMKNGKLFYVLKSFTLKRLDFVKNECFDMLRDESNPRRVVEGLMRFAVLGTALMAAGMPVDGLIDWLLGRKSSMSDRVVDNFAKLFGLTRYTIYQARQVGPGRAVLSLVAPPYGMLDSAFFDTKDVLQGTYRGSRMVQSVPIIGKPYYWWFGYGSRLSAMTDRKITLEKAMKLTRSGQADRAAKLLEAFNKEYTNAKLTMKAVRTRIKQGDRKDSKTRRERLYATVPADMRKYFYPEDN